MLKLIILKENLPNHTTPFIIYFHIPTIIYHSKTLLLIQFLAHLTKGSYRFTI